MKPTKTNRLWEPLLFLVIFLAIFLGLGLVMGGGNMLNTLMKTAHDLILNTVFYLMGIIVISGAISRLMAEYGVVSLLERLLRPLMKPLYNLPGAAAIGAVMTFLSDNPAIMTIAKDKSFTSYFKKYQLVSLTNFGTAFGMGFVVIMTMVSYGYAGAALVGGFGAFVGSIVSTRLMQYFTLKSYPELDAPVVPEEEQVQDELPVEQENKEKGFSRFLNALLDGGKSGVDLAMQLIPGVVIISTFVLMVTFGPNAETGAYDGGAFQGVPVLPMLAEKIGWLFEWCFGFTDMRLLAFPMTALGAVGAALGVLPTFTAAGILSGNAVAVCTAIGMVWSGFLSTHTALLDFLGYRKLISKAILSHTIAGLCAGIVAHLLCLVIGL